MKLHLCKMISLTLILGFNSSWGFSQAPSTKSLIKIYSSPMNPRQHPDDLRRLVKPPDASVFGNQIQFMALRSLDGDFKKSLDTYTLKYELGNVIWPAYPLIYQENLPNVVAELKKRNLYLFDLWGYVPGSGPGGYWQQFTVPQNSLNLFEKELGDHWLGMDNGEQDGRYVGGFASQMVPFGGDREHQYLNFQNHFQGMTERLGNKMSALVSLNFGHYFLKEEVYTLIGAETAQGLPNGQVYYSFIRGAGKQYGVPWYGNASVWNRWGWKNYSGITSDGGGDTKGTSLSLLKRLIYNHVMYNCVAVGFEASYLTNKEVLSPIGKIQQSANRWVKKYGSPGNLYTPVAIMGDFFAGWSFPRHLYSGNSYRVWGNLPYQDGDYLTDNILNLFYPGYQDASYFHDEKGFIAPTPFGDSADCLLSDAPSWLLTHYPVLIIGNKLSGGNEIKDKLEKYVESGGHLIITAGSLGQMPNGLSGITIGQDLIHADVNKEIVYSNKLVKEDSPFEISDLHSPERTSVLATYDNKPLVIERTVGQGKITVFASPFGISAMPGVIMKSEIDIPLKTPFPMLNHVKEILGDLISQTKIFTVNEELSLITCRKGRGEYTVALSNNSWMEKPFQITSNSGKILKIKELALDCSEQKAIGYLPPNVTNTTGKNSAHTIAGGDIRIFNITIDESNTQEIAAIEPQPNPQNRGLTLRNIISLKEEILLRPTFFQHFDRIIIDWKYLLEKERATLAQESGWIKQQGLHLAVDFSSGINLFPDLRLVNNDSIEFARSMAAIKSVIDKMSDLGAEDLIISAHRLIENNFSEEQFKASVQQTIKEICNYAAKYSINVNVRMTPAGHPGNLEQVAALVDVVSEPNLFVAPVTALLFDKSSNNEKELALLKTLKYRILLVGAPAKDLSGTLYTITNPIHEFCDMGALKQLLTVNPQRALILDGLYQTKDQEYLDIRTIEEMGAEDN